MPAWESPAKTLLYCTAKCRAVLCLLTCVLVRHLVGRAQLANTGDCVCQLLRSSITVRFAMTDQVAMRRSCWLRPQGAEPSRD